MPLQFHAKGLDKMDKFGLSDPYAIFTRKLDPLFDSVGGDVSITSPEEKCDSD